MTLTYPFAAKVPEIGAPPFGILPTPVYKINNPVFGTEETHRNFLAEISVVPTLTTEWSAEALIYSIEWVYGIAIYYLVDSEVRKANVEIEKLEAKHTRLSEKLTFLEAKVGRWSEKITHLEGKIGRLAAQREQISFQRSPWIELHQKPELEAAKLALPASERKVTEEHELNAQFYGLEGQESGLYAAYYAVEGEENAVRAEISETQAETEQLKADIAGTKAEIAESEQQVEALKKEKQSLGRKEIGSLTKEQPFTLFHSLSKVDGSVVMLDVLPAANLVVELTDQLEGPTEYHGRFYMRQFFVVRGIAKGRSEMVKNPDVKHSEAPQYTLSAIFPKYTTEEAQLGPYDNFVEVENVQIRAETLALQTSEHSTS